MSRTALGFFCCVGLLVVADPLLAQPSAAGRDAGPTLSIGDPAPPLHIATWVKGPPVTTWEKGKVYVVDVWSTWCIPCLAAMPHTSRLQSKYQDKGLVVIGVTATDRYGNSEEAVRKLVERKGEAIRFAIGIDAKSDTPRGYQGVFHGKTVEAYLGGAQVPAIPAAFVIDRAGRIAFIGHPLEIDEVVEKCLEGKWDLRAARERREVRLKGQELLVQLEKAVKEKQFENALDLCQKLVNETPHEEARIYAAVAGLMAEGEGVLARREPALALKAGQRAAHLTKDSDPGVLSALASVYFARGEIDKAIQTMERAVARSEGGLKPVLEKQLSKYRATKSSGSQP
jgi:thiol-disulfide isomerase/thioredoxin